MDSVQHIAFTRYSCADTSAMVNFGMADSSFRRSDIFCSLSLDAMTLDRIACKTWTLSSRAERTHTNFGFVWDISMMFATVSSYSLVSVALSSICLIKLIVYF